MKKIIRYNIEFYVALIKKLTFNYMYDIILNKEVYTMKKKYIKILIIALFTISIIILFVLLTHLNNKKIIVEDSYINWAGGFSYEGTVICDDGSIYKFSMNDKKDKYEKSYEDLKKLNIAILNNKTKYVGKISEEYLKEIKEFSKDIKSENFQYNYSGGADIGQHSIHIWNYDLNEKITLSAFGDWIGSNSSKNINELINIIKKYT